MAKVLVVLLVVALTAASASAAVSAEPSPAAPTETCDEVGSDALITPLVISGVMDVPRRIITSAILWLGSRLLRPAAYGELRLAVRHPEDRVSPLQPVPRGDPQPCE